MMNDDLKQFEQRLRRQPVKQIPGNWRAEILAAANHSQASRPFLLSALSNRLSALLWPHPVAWAGLAAIWVLLFAFNFSMGDRPPALVAAATSPLPEVLAELHQQHKLYAELMGITDASPRETDRPRVFSPKPRSGRADILAA